MTQRVPHLVTSLPGPKAAAWVARDERVVSPSYTRDYPLVAARGEGCVIEDVDGNQFLDFTAGIAVTATGHCHPAIVQAISDQASRLIHMSGTDFYYTPEIELAERLVQITPGDMPKRVFFTNSGTETIEAALKLSRWSTGRSRIISFLGAFHGRTIAALSIGGSRAIHRRGFGPMLAGTHHLPYDCSRSQLDEILATVAPADEVAAIVVEAIQGEGGYRVPSAGFLPMLRDVCDEHGIRLVLDEIQSGMGRTGRWFAVEHTGVVPDLICIAKGIASGLPLGAMVAKAEIMTWPPGSHASTFGGNPVACRAALATIDLIEREYLSNTVARGEQLDSRLRELAGPLAQLISPPRGRGLMQAVDILTAGQPDVTRRNAVVQAAFMRGLLLIGCGKAAVRFCPGLCVSAEQIDTAVEFFGQACRDAA